MFLARYLGSVLYILYPQPASGQTTPSLSPAIASAVPRCAQDCLVSFISQQYPTVICSQQELGCLCTANSVAGFTLGEGAFKCVQSSCGAVAEEEKGRAYGICQGIAGAKAPTHTILSVTRTATIAPGDHKTSSSPRRSFSATVSTTTHLPSTRTTRATTKSAKMSSKISTRRSASTTSSLASSTSTTTSGQPRSATTNLSSTSTAVASPTAAAAVAKPALTKPQIAGVTVAAVGSVTILLGLLIFCFCIRRRGRNKRDSIASFVGDGIIDSHPSPLGYPPARSSVPGRANRSSEIVAVERPQIPVTPERMDGSRVTSWKPGLHNEEIGVAVAPETREVSSANRTPPSATSIRTTSRLLPEKPLYSLYPSPLRPKRPVSIYNSTGARRFGEAGIGQRGLVPLSRPAPHGSISPSAKQSQLPYRIGQLHESVSDPFLDYPSNSRPMMLAHDRRALRIQTPNHYRPNPELLNHGQWTQSADNLRKPVPARHSTSAREFNRQRMAKASVSPSDYTGRSALEASANLQAKMRQQRSLSKRPVTTYSSASTSTTIEDASDEDEPTPLSALLPIQDPPPKRLNVARPAIVPPTSAWRPGAGSLPVARRRSQPTPLITQNLKPLPDVPELPDSAVEDHPAPRRPLMNGTPTTIATDGGDLDSADVRKTAKWKILVSPGLEGIEGVSSSRSPRSPVWAATAAKKGSDTTMF